MRPESTNTRAANGKFMTTSKGIRIPAHVSTANSIGFLLRSWIWQSMALRKMSGLRAKKCLKKPAELSARVKHGLNSKPMAKKIIILYGPYGAGKSSIIDELVRDSDFASFGGITKVRHVTTRPYRHGEIPGEGVLFVSDAEFDLMGTSGELVSEVTIGESSARYRNGTRFVDLENAKNPVLDMNLEGIRHLEAQAREKGWELFKIFVHAPEAVRRERMLKRELAPLKTADYTDQELIRADTEVAGRMGGDSNPESPFAEKTADLVLENIDLNKVRSAIKAEILNFLRRGENREMSLEFRRR